MQGKAVCRALGPFTVCLAFKDNTTWWEKMHQQWTVGWPAQLQALAEQPPEDHFLIKDLDSQFSRCRGHCSLTAHLWDGKSISWAEPQIPISCTLVEAKINGKGSTEEALATCEVWPSQIYAFKARREQGSHRQNRGWGVGGSVGEKGKQSPDSVAEGKLEPGQFSFPSHSRPPIYNSL